MVHAIFERSAQKANALSGLADMLMIMTGQPREASIIIGLAGLLNLTFGVIQVPPALALKDAALAAALTLSCRKPAVMIFTVKTGRQSRGVCHS